MYEAELHCHTNYSKGTKIIHEGLNTPEQMVRQASKIGLSIMAVTDHNKIKGALEAKKYAKKYNVLVIPSEEVSTKDGHMLAIGIQECIQPGLSIEESIDLVKQQGGVSIASHPFDFRSEGLGDLAMKCHAVELFNAFNVERVANNKCLGFVQKHKLPYVAGSDAHSIDMLGYGRTIFKNKDIDAVIRDIKKGRVSITNEYIPVRLVVYWIVTRFKLSYSSVIKYMNHNYSWPKRYVCQRLLSLVEKSPGNIDYIFKMMAYFSLGGVFLYSYARNIIGIR